MGILFLIFIIGVIVSIVSTNEAAMLTIGSLCVAYFVVYLALSILHWFIGGAAKFIRSAIEE